MAVLNAFPGEVILVVALLGAAPVKAAELGDQHKIATTCSEQSWPYIDKSCVANAGERLRRVKVLAPNGDAATYVMTPEPEISIKQTPLTQNGSADNRLAASPPAAESYSFQTSSPLHGFRPEQLTARAEVAPEPGRGMAVVRVIRGGQVTQYTVPRDSGLRR